MTNASKMRNLFVLFRPPTSAGALGDSNAPEIVATVRGELVFLTGRELYAAKQFSAETTHKIALRYYAGLDATLTTHGPNDENFQVLYVEQDPMRRFTNLYVKVVGATLPLEEGC